MYSNYGHAPRISKVRIAENIDTQQCQINKMAVYHQILANFIQSNFLYLTIYMLATWSARYSIEVTIM